MLANLTAVVAAVHNCAAQCDLDYRCQASALDLEPPACHHHVPGLGAVVLLRDWTPRTPIASGCNASMAYCWLNGTGQRVPPGFVRDRPVVVDIAANVALAPGAVTRPGDAASIVVNGHGPVIMLGCGPLVVTDVAATTVAGLSLAPEGSQCAPMVSARRGTVRLDNVQSAVVTGRPTGTPPTATVTATGVAELGIGHVGGTVALADVGKLVLQLARSARLTVTGEAACTVNVSALTGAFTPEFESVFAGNRPDLGPDPELIAVINTVAGIVAVVTWSGVAVEGLDRLTAKRPKQ